MPPDVQRYLKHVDEFNLTEAQKLELLETLWMIMESFADRAFRLNPGLPSSRSEKENTSNYSRNDLKYKSRNNKDAFNNSAK